MQRILVTGGAGFIGSNLVRRLQLDHPKALIVVIDDFRTGSFANLSSEDPGASPSRTSGGGGRAGPFSFRGEVIARPLGELDLFQLAEDIDPEIIFHQASITDTTLTDQAKMLADNVEPFETLLALAVERGIKLVWASSAATYGTAANGATRARRPFKLDDAGSPANVYGFSKWVMENLARATLAQHPEAHIVGLRYFNVFGPGEQNKGPMASMIYQLTQQMLASKRPRIFHDGQQARDHIYVEDVVEATLAAANDDAAASSTSGGGAVYNVGAGQATTFNALITAINQGLGTNLAPDYFDNPYRFYQDYTCADLTRTKKALNWSPRFDPLPTITNYSRWLKSLSL